MSVAIVGWNKLNGISCYICTMQLVFAKADIINELYTVELVSGKTPILQIDVWADDMIIVVSAKSTTLHKTTTIKSDITRNDILTPGDLIVKISAMTLTNSPMSSYLYLMSEIENQTTT